LFNIQFFRIYITCLVKYSNEACFLSTLRERVTLVCQPASKHQTYSQTPVSNPKHFNNFLTLSLQQDQKDCMHTYLNLMKPYIAIIFVIMLLPCCRSGFRDQEKVKIIFDTDFGPDYDDVGALAFLHAMADSGKIDLLATISSNQHKLVGPSMDAMNTYYGRPDLPMGAPKGGGVNMGAFQHWPDSLISKFPHSVQSTDELPDAVKTYRKILSEQPDTSVTIVTVGFLTNLADLLRSEPDSISDLTGADLISKKVKKLVSMAGRFPAGGEFNVHMDSTASMYVAEHWPTPIIFTGFEIGWEIRTGLRLANSDLNNHPARDVFRMCIPMAAEDSLGRMSWDETAVLIAVYGTKGFFTTVRGKIIVYPDGSNSWIDDPMGSHVYVVQQMPVNDMARFIEDRMMHVAKRRNKISLN
jgi:inosine-uridine nucleoside N-ribohydrolase